MTRFTPLLMQMLTVRIGPKLPTHLSDKFSLIPHPRFPNFLKTRHLKEDSQKISDLVVRAATMLRIRLTAPIFMRQSRNEPLIHVKPSDEIVDTVLANLIERAFFPFLNDMQQENEHR